MFGIFKSKEQKSVEKFWKSEMGQRLTAHNAQYFGQSGVWEGFSPEGQQKFCGTNSKIAEAQARAREGG